MRDRTIALHRYWNWPLRLLNMGLALIGIALSLVSSGQYGMILLSALAVSSVGYAISRLDPIIPLQVIFVVLHAYVFLDAAGRLLGFGTILRLI